MNNKIKILLHPFWHYLNQPLIDERSVWNLRYFLYFYRVQLLRRCWDKEYSQKSYPHH
ncbi:hypothetical protein IQ238_04730 [Pleurocapsales cyanobacterium LEGE 06147]|nr:hypothetical protein [Pleurocapsales cyanobacterium LEGE 06147]